MNNDKEMREILVKLAEQTLYVEDSEIEYVIKYLKDFVEYARKTSGNSGTGPDRLCSQETR